MCPSQDFGQLLLSEVTNGMFSIVSSIFGNQRNKLRYFLFSCFEIKKTCYFNDHLCSVLHPSLVFKYTQFKSIMSGDEKKKKVAKYISFQTGIELKKSLQ